MYSGCKIIISVHMLLIKQDFYLIHYFKTELLNYGESICMYSW